MAGSNGQLYRADAVGTQTLGNCLKNALTLAGGNVLEDEQGLHQVIATVELGEPVCLHPLDVADAQLFGVALGALQGRARDVEPVDVLAAFCQWQGQASDAATEVERPA